MIYPSSTNSSHHTPNNYTPDNQFYNDENFYNDGFNFNDNTYSPKKDINATTNTSTIIKCVNKLCLKVLEIEAKFCKYCGEKQVRLKNILCTGCNFVNESRNDLEKFCEHCGDRIQFSQD